jgi:hypothetical protein
MKHVSLMEKSLVLTLVCLLCTAFVLHIIPLSVVGALDHNPKSAVDLYTQKAPYDGKGLNETSDVFSPDETVILYANVTYDKSPVSSVYVAFQVLGPINPIKNFTFTASSETNESGIASWKFGLPWPCEDAETMVFGVWTTFASVKIGGETVQDELKFRVDWVVQIVSLEAIDGDFQARNSFGRGGDVGVELVLKNIAMTSKTVMLSFLIRDELDVPVAFDEINSFEVQPNSSPIQIFFKLEIPKWAFEGTALLEACAFTATVNATPYSPTAYKNFLITRESPLEIALDDVATKEVVCFPSTIQPGESVNITVAVRNEGTEEESFNVTVYYDSVEIGVSLVVSLVPYAEETLVFVWNTSGVVEGNYSITGWAHPVPGEVYVEDNEFVYGFVEVRVLPPGVVRDVAVVDVWPDVTVVYEGEVVGVSVLVRNEGNVTESFNVKIYTNVTEIKSLAVKNLEPEENRTLTSIWNTAGVAEGNYTLWAEIPPLHDEFDVEDNKRSFYPLSVIERPTFIHDVAIVDVTPNATEVYVGQTVSVTVAVQNLGDFDESFNVSLYCSDFLIKTSNVEFLHPGSKCNLTFFWNTSNMTEGNYTIKAYVPPIPSEINVQNNELVDGTIEIMQPPLLPRYFITWLIIVLVTLVLTVLLLLFLRRKKKKPDSPFIASSVSFYR